MCGRVLSCKRAALQETRASEAPGHRAPRRCRPRGEFTRCPNADSSMPPSCSRPCPRTSASRCVTRWCPRPTSAASTLFHQGDAGARAVRRASRAASRSRRRPATAANRSWRCSRRAACSASSRLFDDAPALRRRRERSPTRSSPRSSYEPVRAVLRARPELLWVIVRLLAERLRATDEALADAVFLDVPARTAKRTPRARRRQRRVHAPADPGGAGRRWSGRRASG